MLKRYRKGIVLLLLLTVIQWTFYPSVAMALTGGPSQPEVQSFEPVGTNQMVDLSTGDFNYNIPLMVVPGPNGGYPINLAYHAGIGMEQEASWVGLGWNINPGAITRNMRGIPDDFSGDKIIETVSTKPDVTVGLGIKLATLTTGTYKEFFGYPLIESASTFLPGEFNFYYNNYRGVGYGVHIAPTLTLVRNACKVDGKAPDGVGLPFSANISFDSQSGLGISGQASFGEDLADKTKKWQGQNPFSVGVGLHSKKWLQDLSFDFSRKFNGIKLNKEGKSGSFNRSIINISFVNSTHVPSINNSSIGTNLDLRLTLKNKTTWPEFEKKFTIKGKAIYNGIKDNSREMASYGTLYLQDQEGLGGQGTAYDRVSDFNVFNDIPITPHNVNLGVPIMTSDIYNITGQGIGGTFRPHRNDLGILYKNGNTAENYNVTAGIEWGYGTAGSDPLIHVGVDAGYGYHQSYNGAWTDGIDNLDGFVFEDLDTDYPLYEPWYFKVVGEKVAIRTNEWNYMGGEDPIAFDMGMDWEDGEPAPRPVAVNHLVNSTSTISSRSNEFERVKRLQNVGFRTNDEITNDTDYGDRGTHVYNSSTQEYDQINYTSMGSDHHVQEYSIIRPDGTTYLYGLPAYNTEHKEVMFANDQSVSEYVDEESITYDSNDAGLDNDEGYDKYFSSTEIPDYVHSNLITEINSADYVDVTGDGPSEDDFGFYVKFNYLKVSDYQWRAPFEDASYIKGYYSNELDDKASYTYGTKDLYYVHSIETKTHIAKFELGDRNDGRGVSTEHQTSSSSLGEKQKYLKTIKLYSKNDLNNPIQTVTFIYDYSLCENVPNNDSGNDSPYNPSTHTGHIINNTGGKLTLKKVYIEYNGNKKGRLSPYEFTYGNNEDYNLLHQDRWGNYQESASANEHAINPYTRQTLTEADRNSNASAWCMNNIKLPSGGEIDISYEADDYGYVQDARAMQMTEIYGFSKTNTDVLPTGDSRFKLKKGNLRLWFKLNEAFGGSDNHTTKMNKVKEYVDGVDEIYFKVFEELKFKYDLSTKAKDYVVGYAQIDNQSYGYDSNGSLLYGYVDLEPADYYKSDKVTLFKSHPFRKAGWQYLKFQRPDLYHNQMGADQWSQDLFSNLAALPISLGTLVSDALSIATLGYYNKAAILGHCKRMSNGRTSFVRLNSPNKLKYGGGHRTKSVTLADNWTEGSRTFGTTYTYQNEDGSSSGVADYEPYIGGEENALKSPVWYNGSQGQLSFAHVEAYMETPLMEAVYPAPRVVYGRIVEKNLEDEDVTESQSGITVHEFYTSKDFPVKESYTELEPTDGFNNDLYIPFVGTISYNMNGFSQGYSVVLNDMSGKPKSMSTYRYRDNGEPDGQPVTKVEYIYRTDGQGRLNNEVTVLDAHGSTRQAILGVEQDFLIHEEESSSSDLYAGGEFNVDIQVISSIPLPLPVPSFLPGSYSYSESMYRGLTTSKVIYKTGILEEVRSYNEGSWITVKNILYDAETGDALLTETNNEWDKPVYNYSYPAHWYYAGMDGAYQNYKAYVSIAGSTGSTLQLKGVSGNNILPSSVLTRGDQIVSWNGSAYESYFVVDIDDDNLQFELENPDGTTTTDFSTTPKDAVVMRSGKRNLQTAKSGSIVALKSDFLGVSNTGLFKLFDLFNSQITNGDPNYDYANNTYLNLNTMSQDSYYSSDPRLWNITNYYNCNDNTFEEITVNAGGALNDDPDIISFYFEPSGCRASLTFTDAQTPSDLGYIFTTDVPPLAGPYESLTEQLHYFKIVSEELDINGDPISVEMMHLPTGKIFSADFDYVGDCFDFCYVPGVLHSDAVTYSDDWGDSYPYADLGNPGGIGTSTANAYVLGKRGIWRIVKSHLYQVMREQTGGANDFYTKIDEDGEYIQWNPFNWTPGAGNADWSWVTEITRYSPYGYALEEVSKLSHKESNGDPTYIYTSQMYGYSNSVVTATSGNASYFEIGFNGFEEDNSYSYSGHLDLSSTGTLTVSSTKSHTGTNSLKALNTESIDFDALVLTDPASPPSENLCAFENKEYIVSMWVNVEEENSKGTLTINGQSVDTDDFGEIVDGWKKLELKFTMGSSTMNIDYTSTGTTYIDDIRFGPYNGGMVTYVYDPVNLWLIAELDALNYATFYNYDEEGQLVQVKKETENGVVTVQTSRSNIQKP